MKKHTREVYRMKYGFGIDIGGTTVKLAYFDETGKLLDKWEIPTVKDNGGSRILADIAVSVDHFLKEKNIDPEAVIGIGVGVPGPVSRIGVVNRCVNLGWGVFNIEQEFSRLTGFCVKAGNDANVAALGECWKGGGRGYSNMVLATLGTGVGGGIIIDGKMIYGAHGAGGEIGHMVLNKAESDPCGCGKYGCVEQYCSATGILRTAKRYLNQSTKPSALRQIENLTCKDVFDAGAAGDAVAEEILETVYNHIAEFVSDVCCVVDPDVVVIGGGVSKAGEMLIHGIRRHMPKYVFHAVSGVELALAQLGNDAGAYGAFKLVLDSYG